MKRRVHQIMKNAGVCTSSSDEDSDCPADIKHKRDIINNTHDSSPVCGAQAAIQSHLEFKDEKIDSPILTPHSAQAHPDETCSKVQTTTSLLHKQLYEVGEISIEAPPYSPLTPKQNIKKPEILETPSTSYCIADKGTDCHHDSLPSSPLRAMSPETSKVFNALIGLDVDSDDSVADPNYEIEYYENLRDDSSDGSENIQTNKRHKHTGKDGRNGNKSPSLLTQALNDMEEIDEDGILLLSLENREEQNLEKNNNSSSSPKKRKVRNPSKWKVNIEKRKRLKGALYKTKKGKIMEAKPIKPAKCSAMLKHKCISHVPENERVNIYNEFRNMSSLQEQRHFIINHVEKKKKNRDTTQGQSRRNFTLIYTLTLNNEKKIVCREFFLDTLNITGAFVTGALKKLNSQGLLLPDYRGKKPPPNKLSQEDNTFIRDHILSFPAVESHYCRRDSVIRYLDSSLNITIMFNDYKEKCQIQSATVKSIEKYRSIFRSYKLSFHKPKKDLCKQCTAFKEMDVEGKIKNQETHELHLIRKNEARNFRDEDKKEAQNDDKTLAFNFDLEAVLSTPKGAAGPFFYVRKLAVYNLTVYNLGNQNVECYMWDETEGKRGSIEISTCINTYIMAHNNIKHVKMMSDGCGGQQKNYHFSSMCLLTVKQHATLQIIDHKFFETGHTHMECDSIHSKIETKAKNVPVYTPDGWAQLVRLARKNPRPFIVTPLIHEDFKDFGSHNQYLSKTSSERKLGIHDAVWLQYRKEDPDKIFIKNTYDKNTPFQELHFKMKRGKTVSYPVPAYSQRLKISSKKKNDLLKLCKDGQIPRIYHSFYENLPSSEAERDSLPEPDATEDSE